MKTHCKYAEKPEFWVFCNLVQMWRRIITPPLQLKQRMLMREKTNLVWHVPWSQKPLVLLIKSYKSYRTLCTFIVSLILLPSIFKYCMFRLLLCTSLHLPIPRPVFRFTSFTISSTSAESSATTTSSVWTPWGGFGCGMPLDHKISL